MGAMVLRAAAITGGPWAPPDVKVGIHAALTPFGFGRVNGPLALARFRTGHAPWHFMMGLIQRRDAHGEALWGYTPTYEGIRHQVSYMPDVPLQPAAGGGANLQQDRRRTGEGHAAKKETLRHLLEQERLAHNIAAASKTCHRWAPFDPAVEGEDLMTVDERRQAMANRHVECQDCHDWCLFRKRSAWLPQNCPARAAQPDLRAPRSGAAPARR